METVRCATCHDSVTPVAPRTSWKVVNVLFWIGSLAVGSLFVVLLGFNVVLMPMWIGIAMAVGTSARRAAAWTCPECHGEVVPPVEAAAPSTSGPLVPQPA